MDIVLGIILLVAAVFLIVAILMQDGKQHNLSGAIAGGSDTFYGKNNGKTMDKMLAKITSIVAIVFCLLVVAMYVFQEDTDFDSLISGSTLDTNGQVEVVGDETTAADAETTAAPAE